MLPFTLSKSAPPARRRSSAAPASVAAEVERLDARLLLAVLPEDAPAVATARQALVARARELGFAAGDVAQLRVTDVTTSAAAGLTHVYFQQQFRGLDVDGTSANVTLDAAGQVLSIGNRLLSGVEGRITGAARLSAAAAIQAAAASVGVRQPRVGALLERLGGAEQAVRFDGGNVSLDDVPTKLVYQLGGDGRLHLAWNLNLRVPGSADWFDLNVSAADGVVLRRSNWTHYAQQPPVRSTTTSAAAAPSVSPPAVVRANGVPNTGRYTVFPLPLTAPDDGPRSVVVDPADPLASPFGWHDVNGRSGAEFRTTIGNNVVAQEDRDRNNLFGFRPSGGANLNFNFPFNPTQAPAQSASAAITQLFYLNNVLHDVHYRYGFDERSGNFQVNNYGRGGRGFDPVIADAQDGEGLDNANFSAPPDGRAPRMQQFLFTSTRPFRDGSFDNGIIVHEYGHGVSIRLTGGPANSNSLNALQSGGMGEGWSDFWALMFTQRPGDVQNQAFGIGTYVLGEPATSAGFRRFPYSFDMTVNPLTLGAFNLSSEVHDAGEIWASVLWDMNWLLINKHGFSANLATGTAGNNLALQLVMDGLKIQPANPSFLDARDAILAADAALTGGQNAREIWTAFARRGMGASATVGNAWSAFVRQAFDLPPQFRPSAAPPATSIAARPTPARPAAVADPSAYSAAHRVLAVDSAAPRLPTAAPLGKSSPTPATRPAASTPLVATAQVLTRALHDGSLANDSTTLR